MQARISLQRLLVVEGWLFRESPPGSGRARGLPRWAAPAHARQAALAGTLVLCVTAVAFLVEDLNAVIDLSGALGGGCTAFILPPIAWAVAIRPRADGAKLSLATVNGLPALAGTVLTLFLTGVTIYSFSADNGDLDATACGINGNSSRP